MPRDSSPITARITSGLGNQLFQYAAAYDLSLRNGRGIAVDTSWFDYFQIHQPRRVYRLARLGLEGARNESFLGILRFLQGLACMNQRYVQSLLQACFELAGIRFINESRYFTLSKELFEPLPKGPVVLNGYWQVYHHAISVAPTMRKRIFSQWNFSKHALSWRDKILHSKSAFIHVRRGDYQQFGVPLLEPSYYKIGVQEILQREPATVFFIFSEDSEWTRQNIILEGESHFVDYSSPDRDIEDLLLMASCDGGIIANSSFSWWAAALSPKENCIIAPKIWTASEKPASPGLFPPEWLICGI